MVWANGCVHRMVVKRHGSKALPPFGREMLSEFLFDPDYHNYNFGSFGAAPKDVFAAYQRYQREQEAFPDPWFRTTYRGYIPIVRDRLAGYLNANASDLVLVENTTGGVNAVYRSYRFRSGDKLLMFSNDYPVTKNLMQWFSSVDDVQVVTVNISLPIVNDEISFLAPLRQALDLHPDVRLVTFAHLVSVPGIIQPAQALVALCHSRGIPVLVDGAHAPGQISLDLAAIDADYYIGNNHKWMYTPKGSAFLWVNPRYHNDVVPTVISSEYTALDYVRRFLYVGTRDYCSMVATLDALDFRESLGDTAIKAYMHDLAWWAGNYLRDAWNTTLLAPEAYIGALVDVGLPVANMDAATDLQNWLYDTYGILIISHEQLGRPYTRLSAQIFLEQDDFVELGNRVLEFVRQRT